jgi:hypothetical protein
MAIHLRPKGHGLLSQSQCAAPRMGGTDRVSRRVRKCANIMEGHLVNAKYGVRVEILRRVGGLVPDLLFGTSLCARCTATIRHRMVTVNNCPMSR